MFVCLFVCLFVCSCNDDNIVIIDNPTIESFSFLSINNAEALIYDVDCSIYGDSLVECHIPYILNGKKLVPSFNLSNGIILHDGEEVISNETVLDCSEPLKLQLVGHDGTIFEFILRVKGFTGLPIVYIETENSAPVVSKDEYLKARIRIVEDIETKGPGDIFESSVKIKGRGNSTWTMPKKPYKLKFDEKISILGEPADKEWVLLANYTDKTSLRNETAFDFGRMSNLDYTSRTHFVELVINGIYNGTYQLGEQLKISHDRVNVGDNGYLLEIDGKAGVDDVTFKVNHIYQPINIKDPDIEIGGDAYNYVVKFLQVADSTLFGESFRDPSIGYRKYIDIESFVDWYLINEIAKNADAFFHTSCYMNLSVDDKLKMGPLWDFDIAFGNIDYTECDSPIGFYIRDVPWFHRFFEDKYFIDKVKERFIYFYNNRHEIYSKINDNANYLKHSIIENNNKWNTLYVYTWPNNTILGSYENEVQYLKDWLEKRFVWLNEQFSTM